MNIGERYDGRIRYSRRLEHRGAIWQEPGFRLPRTLSGYKTQIGLAILAAATLGTCAVVRSMPSSETPPPVTPITRDNTVRHINGAQAVVDNIRPGSPLTDALQAGYFSGDGSRITQILDCTKGGLVEGAPYRVVNEVNVRNAPTSQAKVIDHLIPSNRSETNFQLEVKVETKKITKAPFAEQWMVRVNPQKPTGEQLEFTAKEVGTKAFVLGSSADCPKVPVPDYIDTRINR